MAVEYTITVKTGDKDSAGTDANVFITLHGSTGRSSQKQQLDSSADDFERGSLRDYDMTVQPPDIGDIQTVTIEHDNTGHRPGWYLDYIIVTRKPNRNGTKFPCDRWLADDEEDHQIRRTLTPATFIAGTSQKDHSRYDAALKKYELFAAQVPEASVISTLIALKSHEVRLETAEHIYRNHTLSSISAAQSSNLKYHPVAFQFIDQAPSLSFLPWHLIAMVDIKSEKIVELFEISHQLTPILGSKTLEAFFEFFQNSTQEDKNSLVLPPWFKQYVAGSKALPIEKEMIAK